MPIDLNADVGESFGVYRIGNDAALLQVVSSANVACGAHAGDAVTAWRTLEMCVKSGVAVGAHVGHRDLYGFGRREIKLGADEAYAETLFQIGSLRAMLRVLGARLHHVKAHGALYNQMCDDPVLCRAVARATRDFSATLPLVVRAGSSATAWAMDEGCVVVEEAFLDRAYLPDGALVPRNSVAFEAVIHDVQAIQARAVQFVRDGSVKAVDGTTLFLGARTLCVHGDTPDAPALAQAAREAIEAAGHSVQAF
jgi:UPF0271 protein